MTSTHTRTNKESLDEDNSESVCSTVGVLGSCLVAAEVLVCTGEEDLTVRGVSSDVASVPCVLSLPDEVG